MSNEPVVQVEGLTIDYRIQNDWINVINNVNLLIRPVQIHGVVGESGSGKSTLALGLMRYLSSNARIRSGTVEFGDDDLTTLPESRLTRLWGSQISLVPQSPMDSLNPSLTIGRQMAEVTQRHLSLSKTDARRRAIESLTSVQIADPDRVLTRYPHQLSGGMLQRVMIALALSTRPRLIVLDEPTTALDVTTQAVILDLVRGLVREERAAGLYVSHDLGTVAQVSDYVTVLYAGEVMESAAVADLFHAPLHPYTIGLLACLPARAERGERRLSTIPGVAPSLSERSTACVFADRCPLSVQKCRTEKPPLETATNERLIRCWRWREIADGTLDAGAAYSAETREPGATRSGDREIVLKASGIKKRFGEFGILDRLLGKSPEYVQAVDDVSITLAEKSTVGLVGESGSGKTTFARTVVGLGPADEGQLELLDFGLAPSVSNRSASALENIRMVFQNPNDALNPFQTVGRALSRTIRKLGKTGIEPVENAVERYLRSVGLTPEYSRRLPGQLSGGEKQRVVIARAFAAEPAVIVADEPTSSLDVSVQAVILNLLKDLRASHRTSYLFISHDLDVISYLADWIVVMYLGEVVEQGSNNDVLSAPSHPYTEALLRASPVPDPDEAVERVGLEGDVPSPRNKPTGCPFHTRCPRFIGEICVNERPPARSSGNGHEIRCHHDLSRLVEMQEGNQ